jgi:hypothetical protein
MIWRIVATVCMLNDPIDCTTGKYPKAYPSFAACTDVYQHSFKHAYEIAKVMGSEFNDIGCVLTGRGAR